MPATRIVCGNCHACGGPFGYRYDGVTSTEFHCNCKAFKKGKRTVGRQGAHAEREDDGFFRAGAFDADDLYEEPIPRREERWDGTTDTRDPNVIDLGVARVVGPRNVREDPLDDALRALGWEGALYLRDRERWAVDPTGFVTMPLAVKYRRYRMVQHPYGLFYQPYDSKREVYQPAQGFIDAGDVVWTAGALRTDYQIDVMYEHAKRKFIANGAQFELVSANDQFRTKIYERALRDRLRLEDPAYLAFVQRRMHREIDRATPSVSFGL